MSGFLIAQRPDQGTRDPVMSAVNDRLRVHGYAATPVSLGADTSWTALRWGHPSACVKATHPTERLSFLGVARIDNLDELRTAAGVHGAMADEQIILAAYGRLGPSAIGQMVGAFAFVIWDGRRRQLVAARDALGVKRLFWSRTGDAVAFSSSISPLVTDHALDDEYVYGFLSGAPRRPSATIWRGVDAVIPGHYHVVEETRHDIQRHWAPAEERPAVPRDERDQVAEFGALLKNAVGACLHAEGPIWAELSGGIDSSAVYGIAEQWSAEGRRPRIAGTYSFVDDMAGANEDQFLEAVLRERPIRNERIGTTFPLEDDGEAPPVTDEPRVYYAYWARDRRAERLMRQSGASVVLSGGGSDFYLTGTPFYLADLMGRFRFATALGDAHAHAAANRVSTWATLYQHGIRPLYDPRLSHQRRSVIDWIPASAARRVDAVRKISRARWGMHATHTVQQALLGAPQFFELPLTDPPIEKRYPFFDRRLVDFALALDPRMFLRDGRTKWILREAIHGVVPEAVRTRRSKGWIDGRTFWALSHQSRLITRMFRDSILVDAGWLDPARFGEVLARARSGLMSGAGPVLRALSLEMWLRVQTGRWSELAPFFATTDAAVLAAAGDAVVA